MRDNEFLKKFWKKVKKQDNNCWLWKGATNSRGYGIIRYHGKLEMAHRLVYIQIYGNIPKKKPFITHICNNPLCCNPRHLKADTNKGNMEYKVYCDRQARGDKNGLSKLSWKEVDDIRSLYDTGEYSYEKLGKMFNVTGQTISSIIKNKSWQPRPIYKEERLGYLMTKWLK